MNRLRIEQALIAIGLAAAKHDAELAHTLEDRLFVEVLTAIAKAENEQGELARAALRSRDLQFSRWTA